MRDLTTTSAAVRVKSLRRSAFIRVVGQQFRFKTELMSDGNALLHSVWRSNRLGDLFHRSRWSHWNYRNRSSPRRSNAFQRFVYIRSNFFNLFKSNLKFLNIKEDIISISIEYTNTYFKLQFNSGQN